MKIWLIGIVCVLGIIFWWKGKKPIIKNFPNNNVPIVAFGILLHSAVYGWASGRFTSFADVIDSMSYGLQKAAPLFILYIFFFQFFESLCFVFS